MLIEDGELQFGEWLPDQPAFKNPGLIEARNCLPVDGCYTDFASINAIDDAVSDTVLGAYATIDDDGDPEIYAGTEADLFQKVAGTWTDRSGATYTTSDYWRFAQFDDSVIATNYTDVPQYREVGSSDNFADIDVTGTAPKARQVGVVNRFVMFGDLDDGSQIPYAVQWSAIDDFTDWPIPDTADARAKQSGRQILNSEHGAVTAISRGQFFNIIFQKRGITRATYIGGDKVFQFETFEQNRGCWAPQSMIQVGGVCYFLAHDGWFMTDGQTIAPVGDGKVDRWFYTRVNQARLAEITCCVDWTTKCILWNFPDNAAATGETNFVLALNFHTKRFAYAEIDMQLMLQSFSESFTLEDLDDISTSIDDLSVSLDSPVWQGGAPTPMVFNEDTLGSFTGDSLIALFETGEHAPNPFGYTFIRGVRPLVTGQPTSIATQIGYRDNQDDSRSYTNETTRTTRTGVCDYRLNGKFLTCRTIVTGGFDRAMGLGVDSELSDAA